MNFSCIEELQEFLIWCRDNGIVNVQVGEVRAVIDPTAARVAPSDSIEAFIADIENKKAREERTSQDNRLPMEPVDRELLFYSAKK